MAARRRTKRKRSRPRGFGILNALEAYTYGAILSEGIAGTSPWGLLTGATDLGYQTSTGYADSWAQNLPGYSASTTTVAVGTGEISLGDIISQPGQALGVMASNFQSNVIPMAIQGVMVGVGFRFGKRLLRKQISSVNRNIMRPLLGSGIRL